MNAPQRCPKCRVSLADRKVPLKLRKYRRQFTVALSDLDWEAAHHGRRMWVCQKPGCGHRWETKA